MLTRRRLATLAAALPALALAASLTPALALTDQPYDAAAVKKAIASGKPVAIHVNASWCLQCRAQASILGRLAKEGRYPDLAVFTVNYDKQKDVVKQLGVPRSTFIVYRGGKETGRMSWGVTEASVVDVLDKAG